MRREKYAALEGSCAAHPIVRRDSISVAGSKLHGIPILIKGSISAHGMNKTAGSCCLVGSKTTKEASLVTKLGALS